jgi:hypothetical protein
MLRIGRLRSDEPWCRQRRLEDLFFLGSNLQSSSNQELKQTATALSGGAFDVSNPAIRIRPGQFQDSRDAGCGADSGEL